MENHLISVTPMSLKMVHLSPEILGLAGKPADVYYLLATLDNTVPVYRIKARGRMWSIPTYLVQQVA